MRIWLLYEDWNVSEVRHYPKNTGRVSNVAEITDAIITFNASLSGDSPWPDPYPADFPTPRVKFAEKRLPDFNITQNLKFVSERLRCAMELPETAAQFIRVKNLSTTPRARASLYWFLHVQAFAEAIDGEKSDCQIARYPSAKTGAECLRYNGLTGIRFRPDFSPPADLFKDSVELTIVFATDSLAQRVIDAGCTGVQFRHPLWFAPGCEQVVRTHDGAARILWNTGGRDYTLVPLPLAEADIGPSAHDAIGTGDISDA